MTPQSDKIYYLLCYIRSIEIDMHLDFRDPLKFMLNFALIFLFLQFSFQLRTKLMNLNYVICELMRMMRSRSSRGQILNEMRPCGMCIVF